MNEIGTDTSRRWRVGKKVGRTIYLQTGSEPSDNDPLIGVMETRELAREAVDCHNAEFFGDAVSSQPDPLRSAAEEMVRFCEENIEPDESFNPPTAAALSQCIEDLRRALLRESWPSDSDERYLERIIDLWHDGQLPEHTTLHSALGMTKEEYAAFVECRPPKD